jgi:hypothetical protein
MKTGTRVRIKEYAGDTKEYPAQCVGAVIDNPTNSMNDHYIWVCEDTKKFTWACLSEELEVIE